MNFWDSSSKYYLLKFFLDGLLSLFVFSSITVWYLGTFSGVPTVLWVFALLFLGVFWAFSYLRRDYMKKIPRDALDSLLSTVYTFFVSYLIAIMGVIFLVPTHPSRFILGSFLLSGLPVVAVSRYVLNRFVKGEISEEPHRILFTGAGEVGQNVARQMQKLYGNQISVIGFLDDNKEECVECESGSYEYEIVGDLEEFEKVCRVTNPDSLFISISNISEERLFGLMDRARSIGLPVKIISDVFDVVAQKVTGGSQEKFPAVEIQDTPVREAQKFLKRAFDLIFSSLLILLFSPILVVSAVLVKLTSEGPIFYRAERLKSRNETFEMLKLRTMYTDQCGNEGGLDDERSRREQCLSDNPDPRITPVGRWLRRVSIDELPQLFNVLKGDMSLVGPRPPALAEAEDYEEWHKKRLDGWTGITGLWQVSGRTNVDFEDMVLLDIYYNENWSLYLDLKILLKTIPTVLLGRGAN